MFNDAFLLFDTSDIYFVLTLLFTVLLFSVFIQRKPIDKKSHKLLSYCFITLAVSVSLNFFPIKQSTAREIFFQDYFSVNINTTKDKEYSDKFISSFTYSPIEQCSTIQEKKPDSIYIFLVESWSNYHSAFFGNENNWTPNLDFTAKKNISMTNFHANGFTTEAGLYSILTGNFPVLYKKKMKLDGAVGLTNFSNTKTLPKELSKYGYHSYFVTSGNLNFLDKGKWLREIGFSTIIGSDDFPKGSQRYLFNSVSDEELFNKVSTLSTDSTKSDSKLIVVENVSTHAPFYSPDKNGNIVQSEESAFLYTDKLLANLISTIATPNNLVIVLSDHRAMTPVTSTEKQSSGLLAVSKVPAFMIWDDINIQIDEEFQQTDLMNSIVGLVSDQQCFSDVLGSVFPVENAISPKCILHSRGDNRNIITAKCNQNFEAFNILLDGDNTRSINKKVDSKLALDIINHSRIIQN
ncbi:sulfatase-like hydrolase/transferase [Photobacterium rosenbergii]|nr:sulfatase-like hydrolase/transferase [Photobacterium rosenbergii]